MDPLTKDIYESCKIKVYHIGYSIKFLVCIYDQWKVKICHIVFTFNISCLYRYLMFKVAYCIWFSTLKTFKTGEKAWTDDEVHWFPRCKVTPWNNQA